MELTIRHSPKHGDFEQVLMIDKIVYLSKDPSDGETTLIHLTTGEVLTSESSMNTLEARINAATEL